MIGAFESELDRAFARLDPVVTRGRIVEVLGGMIKVTGVAMRIGELCELRDRSNQLVGRAEVVGFSGGSSYISPLGAVAELSTEIEVLPLRQPHRIPCSDALVGRVLDGFGEPIDGLGPIGGHRTGTASDGGSRDGGSTDGSSRGAAYMVVDSAPPDPLRRQAVSEVFDTGVRAIDGLLTMGVGQRIGVFAPAGVGKSTLLHGIARRSDAEITVVALVGERGREVGEFVREAQAAGVMRKYVIVAAAADRSATERVKAAQVATAIAEYFRDQGRRVLLVVDSLTRLARAQREIGLAIGEPPTRRGFPPSVFAALPRLLERTGQSSKGSITAFYAVLTEGEEQDDPIAEEVKAIVDGHIILSRALASTGHFPAIDVLASTSRLMSRVASPELRAAAQDARTLLARYREVELLLQIGEYEEGADAELDRAIALHPALKRFLRQADGDEIAGEERSLAMLREALA